MSKIAKDHKHKANSDTDLLTGELQHVNNPVLNIPKIEKQYLGEIKSYSRTSNGIIFSDGRSKVAIEVKSQHIIRVRMAPRGHFLSDFSYAVQPLANTEKWAFEEKTDYFEIRTAKVHCQIRKKDFVISFLNPQGNLINQDQSPMHWEENTNKGGYYVFCSKSAPQEEAFFAGGDKASHLNLRGRRIVNWNSDTYSYRLDQDPLYKSIPFYTAAGSTDSYGIFFDNTYRTFFDFASENNEVTSFWSEGGEMDYYFIYGPQPLEVVQNYHRLTGTHPLPPLWALGYHQSRWSYYPEEEVRNLAKEFREREIPCDTIHLDIDYMDGYRCFTWDKERFPDPKKLIGDLRDEGFKTVVMIDPGIKVDEDYAIFKEGREQGYFCKRADDYPLEGYVWPGRCQFPDFTNPEVRAWWGNLYKPFSDSGVAGFWNDMNEPALFDREDKTAPEDVRHDYDGHGGSHRKAHNIYGMQMVRATYEGLRKLHPNQRPFTLTRAAFAGTQRYAAVWTGDNSATWEHLKIAVLQLQRLSVSGFSFCGTDIGGFTENPSGELFTRWIQLGVFSPFMRVHSAGDTRNREPWSFGEEFEKLNKQFIELRYRLLPYIYTVFWEHSRYGLPILRPLSYLEPDNRENHNRENEFGFGAHLLVAPVTEEGSSKKSLYLPKGRWYYYFNHQCYEGGKNREILTPLNEMPLFVKGGSVLPEFPVMPHTGVQKGNSLKFKVFYEEKECKSLSYSDQGDNFAFENGAYLESTFRLLGNEADLQLFQEQEGSFTAPYKAYDFMIIGLPFKPTHIVEDGKPIAFKINDKNEVFVQTNADFKKLIIT